MGPKRTLQFLLFALAALAGGRVSAQTAHYVAMADGTRLAVDVHLPKDLEPDERVPALLELTRYWRSTENPKTGRPVGRLGRLDRTFLENGYALVKVDVRGSGASFGNRLIEYGPQEVRDGRDVVEWVVAQPWSSGEVGAYGTSYTGTTAELLAAVKHPAVKAVVPGWSDFDVYRSPARPYGLYAKSLIDEWGQFVGWLDRNDAARIGAGVRRVDGDDDGELLAAAVAAHSENVAVGPAVAVLEFRDQPMGGGAASLAEASSLHWKDEIEASGVPMLVFASWLDAGTAGGALERFQHYSNPQHLVILASSHGGGTHASPYVVGSRPIPSTPSSREQEELRLAFFDHHLKGEDTGVDDWPAVRYFNMGEEALRETDAWPPAGSARRSFYLHAGKLTPEPSANEQGHDEYVVDYDVGTGSANRWATQMGRPVLGLDDRGEMDDRMLTYTSAPLSADLQVTGTPVVTLVVTTDRDDGAFLVYLEDVDAEGRSRYVSEGGLRAMHRKEGENPHYESELPYHTFARGDALAVVPGEEMQLRFELWPTSALFRKGHRLRLAIAGADRDSFARLPAEGVTTIRVSTGRSAPSTLELPIVGE